jgi:pimeloyl-ACP methyl ester carboxylesterase
MNRRNLLGFAKTMVAGLSVLGIGRATASEPSIARASSTRGQMNFAEAKDGTQLFYRSWGTGRPIVFVSAWALHSAAWQYQMVPVCDRGFRCVAFDRRSHGRSSDPGTGYDLDTLADDLDTVLTHLNLTDAILVGHSLGAAESVRYLMRHGTARIARLVLIAPTTPYLTKSADNPNGIDARVFEGMRAAFREDFPGIIAANIKPFVIATTSQAMTDWILQMMTQCSLKALIDCNRSFSTADFRQELPKLRLPVLILQGTADASAPLELTGRETAALLPNATLKIYDGAPHGLIFTHTSQVNEDLLKFART